MIAIHELFDSKTYEQALQRWQEIVSGPFATNEYTRRIVAKIGSREKFEKAFAHLRLSISERTINHVERINRQFRKIQKSRNKLRTKEMIELHIAGERQDQWEQNNSSLLVSVA